MVKLLLLPIATSGFALAFTGWWFQNVLHFTFGGKLSYDGTTFKSLDGLDIIKEWQAVPDSGRAQVSTNLVVGAVSRPRG